MLLLSDADVGALLPMDECMEALEGLFRDAGAGLALNASRYRIPLPNGAHMIMAGMSSTLGVTGLKTYVGGPGARPNMLVILYGLDPVEPLALMSANVLGQIRTGAASGIATKHMARPDASTVGIIGTGRQARTQLEAVCQARRVEQVWAFSPTAQHREAFAEEMSASLGVPIAPVETPEAAVAEADVVVTITNAREPVLRGEALAPGTHVNAAGSNSATRRELDETAVRRSGLIVVDDLPQAKLEAGDLIGAYEQQAFQWEEVVELGQVVAGRVAGRPDRDAITLFESQGVGMEDVAAGARAYRNALAQGVGREIEV